MLNDQTFIQLDTDRVVIGPQGPRIILDPPIVQPPIFTPAGPSIFSLSPVSGARGTQVTINGSGFLGTQFVRFGGFDARSFTVAAETQIIAQVPPDAVTGPVTISGPNGSATGGVFTVLESSALPIVDSFFPLSGTFGTRITITGRNLQPATQVLFNGTPAAFVINTPTQVVVDVPAGSTSGRITVGTPAGMAQSQGIFVVIQPAQLPAISGFSPASGPAGTAVDIFGNNFLGTQEVRFNGVPSNQLTVSSNGQIRAQAPSGAGTGPITVITSNGSAASAAVFSVQAASPLPSISFFNPISGQAGAQITITGTNFANVQSVRFNGVSAGFFVNSASSIMATVPAGAASGPITVTTAAGTASSTQGFVVIAPSQLPSITAFSPGSGPAGTTVTIDGNNFLGTGQVRFNGVTAPSFTVQSNTRITAQAPSNAGAGPIAVVTPAGTATSTGVFSVTVPMAVPVIASFSPASGGPGTLVSISGNNLAGATAVRFNGAPATFTGLSNTFIQAIVPAGASSGRISVTTPAGTVQSSAFFTVVQAPALPTITALSPASGQGGTAVIVTGTQLGGATAVRFNGKDAATFTVQSATQISAMVPLGAATGPVSVVTPAGTAVSPALFTVLPGALPGTRKLKKRVLAAAEVVPVLLRAGTDPFTDEIVAERVISGIRIRDDVELSVVGRLPKGNATVQPTRVFTFDTVATVRLEAGVATPPDVYTIEIRAKSVIDGEVYDPIIYSVGVDPAVRLDVDRSSGSVRAGKSITFNVLLDRSRGAVGLPVTLSAVDLPADTKPVFGEETTTGTSTTLKLRTTPSTPLGEKEFRIRGMATFQGAPVQIRDRKVKLTVKEPRVQLLIDEAKQSQTVEAGKAADYPFTIRRNAFDGRLFAESDRPDFVIGVTQTPANPVEGDSFTLTFLTSSELPMDRSENIDVRLKDADGTLMATATVQLKALSVLRVSLEIQDKDDNQLVAGTGISFPVFIDRSGAPRPIDLVVANAGELSAKDITATVKPSPSTGTMATLELQTRTSTPVDTYRVRVEARLDGRTLSSDMVDIAVFGRVRLQVTDLSLSGDPGATLSTRLQVAERIGFPGPVPVRIEVNQRPLDVESPVQVILSANPVAGEAVVTLIIRGDEPSGVVNDITFIPDVQGMLMTSSAFLDVTVN
ncbi:MAG: hypothetical protein QOH06_1086 [Acidobacteriota bacterium]|jgi:hypothetical protein|nr:hypothetical protein [Acidobacteriota bacterium]